MLLAGALLPALSPGGLLAQEPAVRFLGLRATVLGQAIPLLTVADPVPGNGRLAEIRVVQPMLGARVSLPSGRVFASAMVNLEGLTIPGGELAPGNWGEGFIDRRHPHTYLHEFMIQATARVGPVRLGGAAGKGFATFGTDDPMSRPAVRYPVNHHWSQVLERAVVAAQAGVGVFVLEGSLFNGDEPERPAQGPRLGRVGDSWAVRGLLHPAQGLEFQASHAHVHSPEHRPGAGLDQSKWSASLRVEGAVGARAGYALLEWARTEDAGGVFAFESLLAEGAIQLGLVRPYYRFERTERPEEERLSAFHSRRPHLEDALLGTSRWSLHTAGITLPGLAAGAAGVLPLVEVTVGRVAKSGPGLFEVRDWYERNTLWSLSVGLRVGYRMSGHRMGRYGLLANAPHAEDHP